MADGSAASSFNSSVLQSASRIAEAIFTDRVPAWYVTAKVQRQRARLRQRIGSSLNSIIDQPIEHWGEFFEIADAAALPANPMVSVVMLAYNHEQFIVRAIDGIVAQVTSFPVEILIGEDCSTDGTRAIVQEYQRRYPHMVRVITGPRNVGMMPNTFRTISKARGKYIALCEGDDWWIDKSKLQIQFETMEKSAAISLCFHEAWIFDQKTNRIVRPYTPFAPYPKRVSAPEIILTVGSLVPTASIFMRRDALPPMAPWFLDAPISDYLIAGWAATRGACYYDPRVMSVYRTGTGVSWTDQNDGIYDDWIYIKREVSALLGMAADLKAANAVAATQKAASFRIRTAILENTCKSDAELEGIRDYDRYISLPDKAILFLARKRWAAIRIRRGLTKINLYLGRYAKLKSMMGYFIWRLSSGKNAGSTSGFREAWRTIPSFPPEG